MISKTGGEQMSDCIFCKIIAKELPAEIVWEDELIIGIKDIKPAAPFHILLIPKKHINSLNDITEGDAELLAHIQLVANKLAHKLGIAEQGYRTINNCGDLGGQTVYHIHYHLLGGRFLGWPPG